MTLLSRLAILLILCLTARLADAALRDTVVVLPDQDTGLIGTRTDHFADQDSRYTIDTLLRAPAEAVVWTPNTLPTPGFGFKPWPYWLRFSLHNQSGHDHLWLTVGYPLLNHIDVYLVNGTTVLAHREGGTLANTDDGSPRSHQILLQLPIPNGATQDVYLRIRSESSLLLPLSLSPPDRRAVRDDPRLRILGIFLGTLLALSAYHLVMLMSYHDTSFLLYLPVVFFAGLSTSLLNGVADRYLLPGANAHGHALVPFSISAVAACGLFLTRNFLDTRKHSTGMDRAVLGCAVVASAIAILSLLLRYHPSIILTAIIIPLAVMTALVASVWSWRRGYHPAAYFAGGWFMIVFGAATYALRAFGVLPENALTENMLYVALALMMLLIALALAARYSLMRALNTEAQAMLQQHVQQTNRALELEVEARTRELEQEQRRLAEARRAVMSQGGQVAAGVMSAGLAHEINNPNNFIAVGTQVFATRLQKLRALLEELLADDAPDDVRRRIQQFFVQQQEALSVMGTASTSLSDLVSRFRAVSTNDETEIADLDLVTRIERMIALARPGLPAHVQLTVTLHDYPMMRCRAGQIIQILLYALQVMVEAAGDMPLNLSIAARRADGGLRLELLPDKTLDIPGNDVDWIRSTLRRQGATLTVDPAGSLSLWFPLQISDSPVLTR